MIWDVCYQRLKKTNLKNENCALPFVWDWGEVSGPSLCKNFRKIIMHTQREMHVFAQWMKAQRHGRVTGWICQNLFPVYFILCLWNLGKTKTGKHSGRGRVWNPNGQNCFSTTCLKWRIRNEKYGNKVNFGHNYCSIVTTMSPWISVIVFTYIMTTKGEILSMSYICCNDKQDHTG